MSRPISLGRMPKGFMMVTLVSALAVGCKSSADDADKRPEPTAKKTDASKPGPGGKKSLPAMDRAVNVDTGDLVLPGTLALPERKPGARLPAVVLVHGSGTHDRDEKIEQSGFTFKPFAELSAVLVKAGFAVLRYDKRSFVVKPKLMATKDRARLLVEVRKLSQQRFAADARAALKLLRAQPEIDPRKLFFVGHSIAGLYAPVVAGAEKLAGVVLLAPILLPFREHLVHQAEVQRRVVVEKLEEAKKAGALNPAVKQAFDAQLKRYDSSIATYKKLFAKLDEGTFPKDGMIMGGTQELFKQTQKMSEDLPKKYAAIEPPVLYVNGKNDWICPVDVVEKHRKQLESKNNLKLVILDDLNHFQYTNSPIAFSEQMANAVAGWLKKQL